MIASWFSDRVRLEFKVIRSVNQPKQERAAVDVSSEGDEVARVTLVWLMQRCMMCNEEQEKNKEKKKSTTTRTPEPEQDNTGRKEISGENFVRIFFPCQMRNQGSLQPCECLCAALLDGGALTESTIFVNFLSAYHLSVSCRICYDFGCLHADTAYHLHCLTLLA